MNDYDNKGKAAQWFWKLNHINVIPMKLQIFIGLLCIVTSTCFGQDTDKISDEHSGLNPGMVEIYSNRPAFGFSGLAAEEGSCLIIRSTLGVGGFSKTITTNQGSYVICHSIGQTSVIGTFSKNDYTLMQGFQQPISLSGIFQLPIGKDLFASLYPNPFYHYINISFSDPVIQDIFVSLTDVAGKTIFSDKYPASQLITLHLSHLNSGLYILKVTSGNKQYRANIIKQYQ